MASGMKDREQISIRVPLELYQSTRDIASKRGVSINALVQEGLSMIVQAEQKKILFDSFTLLGQDLREADVNHAFDAQAEVALNAD